MEKPQAIDKVKLLLRLAQSPNENEAANAKSFADKLIEKFELSPEEYEEKEVKPIYNDDDLLFETKEIKDWLSNLALISSIKYDCLVIQEQNDTSANETFYKYFVYGEPSDVHLTKMLFNFVKDEVEKLVSLKCDGRGELYISSFCEGLINGVRINIETEDFDLAGITLSRESKTSEEKEALVKSQEEAKKELPIKDVTKVNKKDKALDVIAYFTGEGFGRKIHIGKVVNGLYLEDPEGYLLEEEKEEPMVEDYSWLKKLF